jgi:hypothetical protein
MSGSRPSQDRRPSHSQIFFLAEDFQNAPTGVYSRRAPATSGKLQQKQRSCSKAHRLHAGTRGERGHLFSEASRGWSNLLIPSIGHRCAPFVRKISKFNTESPLSAWEGGYRDLWIFSSRTGGQAHAHIRKFQDLFFTARRGRVKSLRSFKPDRWAKNIFLGAKLAELFIFEARPQADRNCGAAHRSATIRADFAARVRSEKRREIQGGGVGLDSDEQLR